MQKAKLRTTDLVMFEERVCAGCANYETDEEKFDQCYILCDLGSGGENGCVLVGDKEEINCMMRKDRDDFSIEKYINESSSEEIKRMYDAIRESYHFEVFKKL